MGVYEEVKIVELKQNTRSVIVIFEYTGPYQKPRGQLSIPIPIFKKENLHLGQKFMIKWISKIK